MAAARVLAGLGDPRAVDALHALALDHDFHPRERVQAARALAGLGDPRAADVLHAFALDPDWGDYDYEHLEAAMRQYREHLAGLGDPHAADVLHAFAHDPDGFGDYDNLRVEAAEALAGLGDPRGAAALHALALDHDFHPRGRVQAARALARLRDPRAARLNRTIAADLRYTLAADDRQSYGHMEAAEALAELERFFSLDDAEQALVAQRR